MLNEDQKNIIQQADRNIEELLSRRIQHVEQSQNIDSVRIYGVLMGILIMFVMAYLLEYFGFFNFV